MNKDVTKAGIVWAIVTAIFLAITFIVGTVLPLIPEF